MTVTTDDFNKIWASTSPLTPYSFSESQYKEGWNFIGSTPPSRQMWDFLQKTNDEKMQYLLNNFDNYLPLTGQVQADWAVTDTSSMAYIKNKPDVLTYKQAKFGEPSEWEDNTIQSIARAFPDDHPAAYVYGVKVTLGKIRNGEGHTNLYFPHNGGMYLKNFWGNDNTSGWLTMLHDQNYSQFALPKNGTAVKATADAAGNNIQNTYAKKSDLSSSLSTAVPTGIVQAFAGSTLPDGWLLCDGSAVSRTDYAALFAVIGTTYGAGDGSTTFNLPNQPPALTMRYIIKY